MRRLPALLAAALLLAACGSARRSGGGGAAGGGGGADGFGAGQGAAQGDGGQAAGAGDDGGGPADGGDGVGAGQDGGDADGGQAGDGVGGQQDGGDAGEDGDAAGDADGDGDGDGDGGGDGDGDGDDGGAQDGGDDAPFAFYDCSDTVFPDADLSDLQDDFLPEDWRDAALGVLDRRFPDGAYVARELRDPNDFDRWFRQTRTFDGVLDDLNTGVHEGAHILGFQNGGFSDYSFTLGEADEVVVPRIELFFRSEVYERLPDEARNGFYADLYLQQIGNQGIETLLDEFNAYTYSLLVDVALADQFSPFSGRSSRDGLVTFMLFTEVYLHLARTEHPDDYDTLVNTRGFGDLVLTLFDRAWCVYELSGDDPKLEIDAAKILPHVLDPQWLDEVDRLRAALQGEPS